MYHEIFTACHFANAVLAIAIPSVCLSVIRRYCVKMTSHITVQFALSDSKMSSFVETKKYSPVTTPSPEIFARTDLPLLIASSLDTFCLVAPQL